MKSFASFVFFFFVLVFAGSSIFVVVHELTHLALSNEPRGVCFGLCYGSNAALSVGVAYAKHNKLSAREEIPIAVGFVVAAAVIVAGSTALADLAFEKEVALK